MNFSDTEGEFAISAVAAALVVVAKRAALGAVSGFVGGIVYSACAGNDFKQVVKDGAVGALVGAGLGALTGNIAISFHAANIMHSLGNAADEAKNNNLGPGGTLACIAFSLGANVFSSALFPSLFGSSASAAIGEFAFDFVFGTAMQAIAGTGEYVVNTINNTNNTNTRSDAPVASPSTNINYGSGLNMERALAIMKGGAR